ncbi:Rpn family recombination-promoting nuclease/putative transposase [Lactobacillus paragasseri]|uniref:Rpn family recombination-promoting nuclease/putative transposase n=1 Tax=Lactobacillus paragasseri TaxID=2107999 RepID=UPI0012E16485|nr:Rpn family recombination-promoting nuclease/putative transposase [Lactobacillus paragasseri]MDK8085645.1 Rpn family recombination-promoting nuclease/putative transposase [Lactobacillus paragasseri]MDX5117588.1 Rpn family recombination-promoting nuclease/putative transposase [Lactobacillus paragasseri]MDX5121468.1 Rpn family recombination-promoting nuclease/putative transposase [Lactobacillus paragasseri]QGT97770.1 Rpn family recombination-promoting nuclease/putative transposase [Lactobacillu
MKKQKKPDVAKLLGITDDLVFQNVMKDPVNCRMFLHEVLPDLDIQGLTVRTQERIAFNKEEKFSVLDVLIKDSQGRRYDIEMQVAPQKDLDKRARYYMYKMMEDGFLHQGEGYGELTAVYVIFVLPFDPKGKGLKRYTFTYSAREDKSVELNDESEIIYLNSKGEKGSVSQGLEDFYSLMEGKNTTNSEFIKRIKKTMDNYRKTEEWSEHVMNTEQIKEMALAQGVEQGLEQGRREARIFDIRKIVKILKRMNQSDEQILQELKQDYSDDFSDEELEKFLK